MLLVLECVKELDEAFLLMEVLKRHEVPLQQVGGHLHAVVDSCWPLTGGGRAIAPIHPSH